MRFRFAVIVSLVTVMATLDATVPVTASNSIAILDATAGDPFPTVNGATTTRTMNLT